LSLKPPRDPTKWPVRSVRSGKLWRRIPSLALRIKMHPNKGFARLGFAKRAEVDFAEEASWALGDDHFDGMGYVFR